MRASESEDYAEDEFNEKSSSSALENFGLYFKKPLQ